MRRHTASFEAQEPHQDAPQRKRLMLIPIADVPRWYAERKPKDAVAVSHGADTLKPALGVGGEADWNAPNSIPADFKPEGMSDEPLNSPVARYWKAMTSGGSTGRPKVILDHQPAVIETAAEQMLGIPPGVSLLNPGP